MKLSKIIVAGLTVLSCGCLVQSVSAIPTLTLSDGTTTIVVTDGSVVPGAVDSSPLAGAVTFNGSLGNFILNVSTGLTKPLEGSASAPSIDLNSVDFATGAGTLTITFSETGFTAFPGILTGEVGGTIRGGSLTNIVMQNALNLVTNGPLSLSPFAASGSAALIDGAPYSLTETAILTFGPGGGMASFDASGTVVGVPDGGMTLTMLGIGLLAVGAARRLYRRAKV